jgi:chromosome segregation ATPase
MISSLIENSLKGITTNIITDIFISGIIILFLLAVLWIRQEKHFTFTNYAPSLLTSVGILGTFTGIVIGLFDFNPQDIDGSITSLLDGLKVAFITSLCGIFASITLKFITSTNLLIKNKEEGNATPDEIDISDLYNIMNQQNENIIKLKQSLSDNDDSSLIGQIKLLRSDMSDNNKIVNKSLESFTKQLSVIPEINTNILNNTKNLEIIALSIKEQQNTFNVFSTTLWIKLQDFADMLSKSATEQVINALKEVIRDFNDKLTEQFGENFKELNHAVLQLVKWQDNYKEQLSDMRSQFDISVDSMSEMEKSIESISSNSKTIPISMDELKVVITTNQHQVEELGRHLDAFKDIRDRAVEAVPEIRNQIDTTVKGIQEASLELMNGVSNSTTKITNTLVQNAEDFTENVTSTNKSLVSSADTLTTTSTQIREQLDATILDIDKHIRLMVGDLSTNSKEVSKDFKEVGSSLIEEMKNSNSQIQNGLSTLTENLQSDITNLANEQTKQMHRVFDGLDSTVSKTIQQTGDNVSNQVKLMDEIAGKEIQNVMTEMGKALAQITNQFTNDYARLVSEMKKITENHR